MRFNPPPNWPPPPEGWTPPPDWAPDPSWPPLPPGWQLWVPESGHTPLHGRKKSHKVRNWVLGIVGVLVLLLGAAVVAIVVLVPDLPPGYTSSDVCWSDDGDEEAQGVPVVEVPCWDDHDYVSGETVTSDDQCPTDTESYLEVDGEVICLRPPKN